MKKVLIVSYYFPPCSLTAANRVNSWALYFKKFGLYPVIVTRHWNAEIKSKHYTYDVSPQAYSVETNDLFEVHRLPFFANKRTRNLGRKKNWLQRLFYMYLATQEALLRNVFPQLLPYGNMFSFAKKIARNNKVNAVLVSGGPFQLFKIGHDISKKLNIPWFADYRDGWTCLSYKEDKGPLTDTVRIVDQYFERKWLKNSSLFFTVSGSLKDAISDLIQISGHIIYNGFYEKTKTELERHFWHEKFTLLYSGSLYPNQNYRTLVKVVKELHLEFPELHLIFLGSNYNNDAFENDKVFDETSSFIEKINRVDYATSLTYHASADVFLMIGHEGFVGLASSKIFDYLKFERPIVFFKNDKDIIEHILQKTGLGVIADTESELLEKIKTLLLQKRSGFSLKQKVNQNEINFYSRENQAKEMVKVILEILK